MDIIIKRIYEPAQESDGKRVLVDRLWPRGVSKENARLDEWLRDIAPSARLREWFCHKEELFDEFIRQYRLELDADPLKQAAVQKVLDLGKIGRVTLLYGAKDPSINQAAVLAQYLRERAGS